MTCVLKDYEKERLQLLQELPFCDNNTAEEEINKELTKEAEFLPIEYLIRYSEHGDGDKQINEESDEKEGEEKMQCFNTISDNLISNKEDTAIIWFDDRIDSNDKTIRYLRRIYREINDYILFYNNQSDCISSIKSMMDEKIFLIVSSLCADDLLAKVHSFKQIISIGVYCTDKRNSKYLLEKYSKILGIFNNQQILTKAVKEQLRLVEKQSSSFLIYDEKQKTFRSSTLR